MLVPDRRPSWPFRLYYTRKIPEGEPSNLQRVFALVIHVVVIRVDDTYHEGTAVL